ncbi:DEAD/DEAH box helicase [Caldimonas aquatica]|uniref:ATP-dependent RNA helicase RhlE n=1 Tax=Caldimonas aquatica TaxID=376175 RepID=A0ABY6MVP0_9BURK|nr:DEAD/DEAH box helicase [Schlegelella aquatica]UZD56082.1 DEAD/DEAH box helicase [Schlegelella aquatica]
MTFAELGLAEPLVRAVREQGYETPTPIQRQAIPAVLAGGDLLAGARTGTGKTAGFTLPLLHRLAAEKPVRDAKGRVAIRALILTPTRELAAQVEESVRTYGKYLPLKSMVMFGGVGMQPQIDALRRGVDILVATPGRLLDHHQQGTLDMRHVQYFVLDEADRMLDMGFIHDIRKILAIVPPHKQSLLFSATFSDEIKALAERLLNKPQVIEVARRNTTAETVAQRVHPVDRDRKKELLAHLIKRENWHQVLVFTRMKHGANRLVEFLQKEGITAMAIHGNKSQGARTRALAEFKSGELQVLVATDIAARGIDIDQLPHVVNFELPNVPEDYVHRIGRTGRAGAQGEAISLVCVDEEGFLHDIEKLIKRQIPRETVPGFEPDPNAKPEPIKLGRMTLHGGLKREGARTAHEPRDRGGRAGRSAPAPSRREGGAARAEPPRPSARNDGHGRPQGPRSHEPPPAGAGTRAAHAHGAARSSAPREPAPARPARSGQQAALTSVKPPRR